MMSSGGSKLEAVPRVRAQADSVKLSTILRPDNNNFGLMRLALAFAVLASHAYYLKTGSPLAEPLALLTAHSLGEHAVQVFFFLSGVMVAQSLDRSSTTLSFVMGRVLRIFPGLIVCVLLTAFILGPLVSDLQPVAYFTDPQLVGYLWRTLALTTGLASLPGVFETLPAAGTVNMSLWTLKYEVLCYACLAFAGLLGLFAPRRRALAATLLAAFIVTVFLEAPDPVQGYTAAENVRYFALFFATGTLAYLLRDILVINAVLLAILGLLFYTALGTHYFELASALFLGYGALCFAALPTGRFRHLANRYDLSFGVYIYACPLQQQIVERLPHASAESQMLIAGLAVIPFALLSWVLVEKPALQARSRLTARLSQSLFPARAAMRGTPRA